MTLQNLLPRLEPKFTPKVTLLKFIEPVKCRIRWSEDRDVFRSAEVPWFRSNITCGYSDRSRAYQIHEGGEVGVSFDLVFCIVTYPLRRVSKMLCEIPFEATTLT